MDRSSSNRSYDSDNSEVEQPPPPGGYVWSDEDVSIGSRPTSPCATAMIVIDEGLIDGLKESVIDDRPVDRELKARKSAQGIEIKLPSKDEASTASSVLDSTRSDSKNPYNDAAGLAVGHESLLSEAATDLDYVQRTPEVSNLQKRSESFNLRPRKKFHYSFANDDTPSFVTRRTSSIEETPTAKIGADSRKSIRRRVNSLQRFSAGDGIDTEYVKFERRADRLIRSCINMLGDSSTLFLPIDFCLGHKKKRSLGARKKSAESRTRKRSTLRYSQCPEWLLDTKCARRSYSTAQLVIGEALDMDAKIIYAFNTRNSNLKQVSGEVYVLLEISPEELNTNQWQMKKFPQARWRVRLGTSGKLANLRIDQAVLGSTSQEHSLSKAPTGNGAELTHECIIPMPAISSGLKDVATKKAQRSPVSTSTAKSDQQSIRSKIASAINNEPSVSNTKCSVDRHLNWGKAQNIGGEQFVRSEHEVTVEGPSIQSLESSIGKNISAEPKQRSFSTPTNDVAQGSRSVRFSSDTLADEINTSDTQLAHSCSTLSPLQEFLRETVSRKPIRSLSNYLSANNIEILHLAGVGGFGFVVVIRRVKPRVARVPSEVRVLKFVPIENLDQDSSNLLVEVRVARQLSNLRKYAIPGFPEYFGCEFLQGRLPDHLKALLEKMPDTLFLTDSNLTQWLFIEMEYVGISLDYYRISLQDDWQLDDYRDALSILGQLLISLAGAEKALKFEHRDCHWGNILVNRVEPEDSYIKINFGDVTKVLCTRGIRVAMIDFSLARCVLLDENNRKRVQYSNLNERFPEIFQQSGSLQYDVYKEMIQIIGTNWAGFHPRTNVLWIEYLLKKLLNSINYKARNKKETVERVLIRRFYEDLRNRPATSSAACLQRFLQIL